MAVADLLIELRDVTKYRGASHVLRGTTLTADVSLAQTGVRERTQAVELAPAEPGTLLPGGGPAKGT
ncbi:hypothetical protein [Streptomyces sp. NPDC013457]|uniref:hypothetical protein n=1 Tax=Streptomyces sp. NPDC013457 TaxID=3364866 RepID=UPI0036FEB8F9